MSIQTLRTFHQQIKAVEDSGPHAFIIVANPVWGRCESENLIAIFDTKEMADAYMAASRLPEPVVTEDKIRRIFRPDSLLYDFNPHRGGFNDNDNQIVVPLNNATFFWQCTENPTPPSGPVPPMRLLDHPQYGKDYDVGFGGPITNTDHEVPKIPA